MIKTAFVNIWDKRVGAIAWDSDTNIASFEYDPSFLKENLDISPIEMPVDNSQNRIYTFPELKNNKTFKGLPGLLADILPDKYGNALIDLWLARQGRAPGSLSPVETLCFIGTRGMGALEIEPAYPKAQNNTTRIEIGDMVDIAEKILSGRNEFKTNVVNKEKAMTDILKIGTSAGGARAKAIISFNPKTGEVRSGQTNALKGFSHWLIKFDGVIDKQFGVSNGYGRVEMAYYLMAQDCGIKMSECRILEENGRAHFMTKRFDRLENNEKLHVQTFCAMRHFDFNDVSLHSYEQLFETMRIMGLTYPEAEQLYRRMVFNVMSRNCDDHTKNFSFIMDRKGNWSLSPAYDLCHAYRPGSEWVSQHSLSINGKRKDINRIDFLEVAKQMNVKKAYKIIDQISHVIENWTEYAIQVKVKPELRDAIGETLTLL